MEEVFFKERPKDIFPQIYVYKIPNLPDHEGYLKIGYTERKDVNTRIKEQLQTAVINYEIVLIESAMKKDGTCISDHDIHNLLSKKGFKKLSLNDSKNEWFQCDVNDVKVAINELRDGLITKENRNLTFKMRPEQKEAVSKTIEFYHKSKEEDVNSKPKFLWNCKMRFGKTFTAFELAKEMDFKKILVLTFKPAVELAWKDDLLNHIDFENWQFVSDDDAKENGTSLDKEFESKDKTKPIVVFGSFQNLLGTNDAGGIKAKNEFIHTENWDLVIFDEYHYGAWRENAKKLFDNVDGETEIEFNSEEYASNEAGNAINETFLPITTNYYLYLSGTPFRALNSGEFIEDQIYNWTYSDEQKAKLEYEGNPNPYLSLPKMILMTYQIPDAIKNVAVGGEFDEFDLNVFFQAEGKGKNAEFKFKDEVQKWLNLIRGNFLSTSIDSWHTGVKPPMPYSDARLLNILNHTLWLLPSVASCEAMFNLLNEKQNTFFHDYKINLCAGPKAGIGIDALKPVINSMEFEGKTPLETKTITLSCGKLTTGVTVKPWTGIFMLRNLSSPETYFQSAFRVQSPWVIKNADGSESILKEECFIFDFALNRALRQISDYATKLDIGLSDPEKKVSEFIKFLPVLAFDGSSMNQVDAQDILDITLAGTSATLLAKRWESALLVNVDNFTLTKLLNNKEALDALMNIEGFRSLNKEIETIINKSEHVKEVKKEKGDNLSKKDKKEISQEEKEFRSKRKEIQEKLIKFATRIPVFMYLTDNREKCLKDVITQFEPDLFKKVTGLTTKDFELLCSIGVFNSNIMNDAIFKFKRYEDSSLSYSGIEKQGNRDVGLWDVTIKREEFEKMLGKQQLSMSLDDSICKFYDYDEYKKDLASKQKNDNKKLKQSDYPKEELEKDLNNLNNATIIEENNFDESKIQLNQIVVHNKFGDGIIIKKDDVKKHIIIKFDCGEKMFGYPSSFLKELLKFKE